MRIQELFGKTLRDAPADAEMVSHQLALRAGLVRPIAPGHYAWLPLGWRVMQKIAGIVREELAATGAQEMAMPLVYPAELKQQAGRAGSTLPTAESRDGREFVLGPTHDAVLADLAAHEIESYRDLPKMVYQFRTNFCGDIRPRGGLIALREFTTADAYGLDRSAEGGDASYRGMLQACLRVCSRVGVSVIPIETGESAAGGQAFAMRHPQGQGRYARCERCGYAADLATAQFVVPSGVKGEKADALRVATPDCKTIEDVARFIGVETRQTLKAVFFVHNDADFVFVVIRGDLEVSESKLLHALGGGTLRAAAEEEVRAAGAEPGYASPVGLAVRAAKKDAGIIVAADRSIKHGANFVAGANEAGFHLTGVNHPRDFGVTLLADLAEAFEGAQCGRCRKGSLRIEQAIMLGQCQMPGAHLAEALGATFQDESGQPQPIEMSVCSLALERLIAAVIEAHNDDNGVVWPRGIAPFDVHLVTLGKDDAYHAQGRALHEELERAGLDVLLDDRAERPGVKFADADLIGVPLRITISERAADRGALEAKWRHESERFDVPLADAVPVIKRLVRG